MDWRATDWWALPGPARFLRMVGQRVVSEPTGQFGLCLPERRPDGLIDALLTHLEIEHRLTAIRVDLRSGLSGRSPAQVLAAAAGLPAGSVRSTGDLLDAEDLMDRVFVVENLRLDEWTTWAMFLNMLRLERARRDRLTLPCLLVVVPAALPPSQIRDAFGVAQTKWIGATSRLDTQLLAESLMGWGAEGFAKRVAIATVTEVAGFDPTLVRWLAMRPVDEQLDPRRALRQIPNPPLGEVPCWSNGFVDEWDGITYLHSLALLGTTSRSILERRIWRGHVRTLFPMVEHVRQAFVHVYDAQLRQNLPFDKEFGAHQTKTFTAPADLEIVDVCRFLEGRIPTDEHETLRDFSSIRRNVAHQQVCSANLILRASERWEAISERLERVAGAWDWPRCGQCLTILVGPSGAGKSTFASANYSADEIVSSDSIRMVLYGAMDMAGDQTVIFERVRGQIRTRLSLGLNVVVDATNLKREDRLANALIAPRDIDVEYVLIDRPVSEKLETAGWRADKPGLIESHTEQFLNALPELLAGDNLPNVKVRDLRQHAG